jgi:hypothetical protein
METDGEMDLLTGSCKPSAKDDLAAQTAKSAPPGGHDGRRPTFA